MQYLRVGDYLINFDQVTKIKPRGERVDVWFANGTNDTLNISIEEIEDLLEKKFKGVVKGTNERTRSSKEDK